MTLKFDRWIMNQEAAAKRRAENMDEDEVPVDPNFQKLCDELMGLEYRARYAEDQLVSILDDLKKDLEVGMTYLRASEAEAHYVDAIESIIETYDPERIADRADAANEDRIERAGY